MVMYPNCSVLDNMAIKNKRVFDDSGTDIGKLPSQTLSLIIY